MPNLKMTLAYDGRAYLGWQKTQEGPSIEESLQLVLEQIFQEPMPLQAASRTDAGVHAVGQVVNCVPSKLGVSLERLRISLNQLLPEDIRVLDISIAADNFHPTLDCQEKEYHYWICNCPVQLPQNRFYSWHVHRQMNIENMRNAAKILEGRHDFSAFCNALNECSYESTVREIKTIQIHCDDSRLCLIFRGTHFLYRMVRNLAGTLVYVGLGKISEAELTKLLAAGTRSQAGVTAPAHGLTLFRVGYGLEEARE